MNELLLYGTVGSSWWDEEYFTARTVRDTLAGMSGPLTVRINSGGGIATEGQAIYTALRGYAGAVNVVVEGIAASAASLIAMAGDTITMSPGSILMIHDPAQDWLAERGTSAAHRKAADALDVIANAYAGIYARRSGKSVDDAREVMKAETYFDGPSAVEAGFATSVDDEGDATEPAAFDYRIYQHAPERLLSAAGALQRERPRASVLAMMAGFEKPTAKGGKAMAMKTKPAPKGRVTATTAAEEENAPDMEEDIEPEMEGQSEEDGQGDDGEMPDGGDGGEGEDDGAEASAARAIAIINMCGRHGVSAARAADFIGQGMTTRQVYAAIKGKGEDKVGIDGRGPRTQMRRDETETKLEGMIGALMGQTEGPAADFRGLRLKRLAMELGRASGRSVGFNDTEAVRRGMRATTMMGGAIGVSDFAYITTEVMSRTLLAEYQRRAPQWQLVTGAALTAMDFRELYAVRFGGDFQLKSVQENGEYQTAKLADEAEGLKVERRGRTITLSFEAVINDDMGAFARIPREFATAARAMENGMVWSLIRSNVALKSDGKALFHADHGNLAASGGAISVTTIAAARKAMAEMKMFGSKDPDDFIAPEAERLIVPPALELAALQFTADILPTKSADANPYKSRFEVHTVPNLGVVAGGSDTAWYLVDPDLPPIQHAYLSGYEAPTVETIEGMNPDAVKMNARHIFGAAAVEFRGSYKNAGA
ncbi:ATP-dependent protease ClpP protease subunit [Gemmobacter caeni]|uniref:ATP-dependent protease ClpP protease subunit n=1 Tax=Gemmobacter caeni TaxID=589035 RepID=A0A2T6A4H4_9RHOB|nr:head maturation protease, ClpP-related [Gemmobacter caeni]PTX38715.1 ATP-dependent protease ClpP protease subunit [Gemmobacter caeni]TWJ05763.1 ATP-dependent protease ClpP protease subunit [Gemmobacter caeni]